MAAPRTPILDSFGGSLSNWTNPAWGAPSNFTTSGGVLVGVLGSRCLMAWTATFTAGDLECYATLPAGLHAGSEAYLFLKNATSSAHGYQLIFDSPTSYIVRRVTDDFTSTIILTGSTTTASGDKIALQRIGSNLNLWRFNSGAWSQFDTVSDATYNDLIYIGIGDDNGTNNTYDDFGGGVPITTPGIRIPTAKTSGARW